MVGQLDKIRSALHNRLRTATLRNDFEGQVRILQCQLYSGYFDWLCYWIVTLTGLMVVLSHFVYHFR